MTTEQEKGKGNGAAEKIWQAIQKRERAEHTKEVQEAELAKQVEAGGEVALEEVDPPVRLKRRRVRNNDHPSPMKQYPWLEWFMAGGVRAKRGVHYHCGTASFIQQGRNAAKGKYSLKVKELAAREGAGVLIKATPLR